MGSRPGHLGRSDVIDVSEGTLVAALASMLMYLVQDRYDLPLELEWAALVLIYAGVRLGVRWIKDTTGAGMVLVDVDVKVEENHEGAADGDSRDQAAR